jgi:hypothetical protein
MKWVCAQFPGEAPSTFVLTKPASVETDLETIGADGFKIAYDPLFAW